MIGKRILKNKSLKINLKKRNFPEDSRRVVGDFSKYIGKAGVWACYGMEKDGSADWICLNVGQSKDIGKEMRTNRMYSKGIFMNKPGVYTNYKGVELFRFDRPKNEPVSTRQRVWKDIGDKYKCLYFVIVFESEDEKARLKEEKTYATKNEAQYWNYAPGQR